MIENFKGMIESGLELTEPWYAKGAEFHESEPALREWILPIF